MTRLGVLGIFAILCLSSCAGGGGSDGGGGGGASSLSISTTSLPGASINLAYNTAIQATPSAQTYVWSLDAGALPPGLTIDTVATGSSTSISGTPTSAGNFTFTVRVEIPAVSQSATRQLSISVAASGFPPGVSVTDVTVSNTVRVAGVKKFGINVGGHDRWGAAKILKNQLPNPGFEPGVFGTVWLARPGSTSGVFEPDLWNTTSGNQPAGFWDGAEYEIVYGPGAGASGTVASFVHNAGNYRFNLGGGTTALNQYDVMFTRRTFPGTAYGLHEGTGVADTSNPYSGVQSLRLAPNANFSFVQDTSWRDGDQSSHKLLVVQGDWRVRLKARGETGTEQIRVRFYRDGGAPYNPSFINRLFNLTGNWATYTEDQTIAPGTDQTPDPWPASTYRPALTFRIEVPATNAGNIWIDEVELYRVDDATNPTVFSDRFVQRLQEYSPGVLRWWAGQLGETLDNMTRPWQQRGSVGYKPSATTPGDWNYGAHEFLQLCQHIGAEPWIVMPPTASQQDLLNFMEYLCGTSGTYATRRTSQGQTAPWTTVFSKIHLEWGNELWGAGDPGDPFGGASVRGGVRLGRCADRAFAFMKGSSWYTANSSVLNFIVGGQAGYAGRQQEIEANSNDHDSTALAPYFGELSDGWSTDAQMFGPLFAYPFYHALHANGRMRQSKQYLVNGGNNSDLSIYEINFHTTGNGGPLAGLPTTTRNEFVAGASGAIAMPLNMLVYLTELEAREQCGFCALGYAYRFDTSGGWPPAQNQFVHIWGMLRDLYHYNLKRPTWLGVELVNKAVMGDAITTTHTGDNPDWTQSGINGVGAATTVNYVQSFAFRSGNTYGIVLMNLDLVNQHGVRLNVPGTPQANANIWRIEPNNIRDMNLNAANVTIQLQAVTNFASGYEMVLPKHSIRAIVWQN
ncbi:MAG: hypothetical protein KF696_08220 [Planctomycetes bacterium]|nr:hypothetical protein [Planctomycetota bacterium]MCW8135664.1 hypothetical protein [Planctomycetota bacterium]